ncbi:MAG: diphosphomevalonate decarboxylase [Gammaproteobacteria bacterium TMED78]|nr:MAG: diphosphomevalonate decarboxylase [Gammaproteobacteria bacterium TMED78]|tara:strand:- start:49836 stop:50801 length:966 start_codon:yes stop_codon:yes gene_type:complete
MKASFKAKANIALIKYWGKTNRELNLPAVGSISITLDSLWSDTEVVFDESLERDFLYINGEDFSNPIDRIKSCLDLIRKEAKVDFFAKIISKNNFPTASGLASSASGLAAIVLAASKALNLELSPRKLSIIARHGSGSAARSIYSGFVEMFVGKNSDGSDSFAKQIAPASHWPLEVVIAVTDTKKKEIGSRAAMELSALTSPFYNEWIKSSVSDLAIARDAIMNKDFESLSSITQSNCIKMHSVIMTSNPPVLYWNQATLACIKMIMDLQKSGVPVFFTVDAGPQVKAICKPESTVMISDLLKKIPGVKKMIISTIDNSLV